MTKIKEKAMAKVDLEYKKAIEKAQNKFNAEIKELSKANFEDFRKGVIKQLRHAEEGSYAMYDMICTVAKNEGKQRDVIVKGIAKAHKPIGKSFKDISEDMDMLFERVKTLEGFMLVLSVKVMDNEDEPFDYQWKNQLASMLSIDLDKMNKEFWTSLKEKTPEAEPESATSGA